MNRLDLVSLWIGRAFLAAVAATAAFAAIAFLHGLFDGLYYPLRHRIADCRRRRRQAEPDATFDARPPDCTRCRGTRP